MSAGEISASTAQRIIAYAAAHGVMAARALARAHQLTPAAIDTFCRENSVAIRRARIVLFGRTSDDASRTGRAAEGALR